MATPPTIHDHPRPDLLLHAAHERIAELRATAQRGRRRAAPGRGPVAGLRDGIAARLIALGEALATDDVLRRRPALHR